MTNKGKKNNNNKKGQDKVNLTKLKQDIVSALKPVVKTGLISGGAALGGVAGGTIPGGAPLGAKLGSMIGAKISKLIGSGDYAVSNDVKSNSLVNTKSAALPTEFVNDPHCVRIRRREYVGDIIAGAPNTFNIQSFSINPGLGTSFPYLSRMAALYEEYAFVGLAYEYVSMTSPYLSGGAMGAVIMAAEYNPYGTVWATKLGMENSDFAISARPDQNMLYGVECAPNGNTQNSYYVRSGASSAPLNATDLGTMYVASQTPIANNTTLGELWVVYDVVLKRPYITLTGSPTVNSYFHMRSVGFVPTIATLPTFATISGINLTMSFSQTTAGTLKVTVGNVAAYDVYIISNLFLGGGTPTGTYLVGMPVANVSGCALINGPCGQPNVISPNTNATAAITNFGGVATVQVSLGQSSFSFDLVSSTTSATAGTFDIIVTKMYNPGAGVSSV